MISAEDFEKQLLQGNSDNNNNSNNNASFQQHQQKGSNVQQHRQQQQVLQYYNAVLTIRQVNPRLLSSSFRSCFS
jgi:hypothetical protein